MKVKELQGILDRIVDKNAPIEFSFLDYKNSEEDNITTAYMKIDCIQDDSYFRDEGDKMVFIGFRTPEVSVDANPNEKELNDFWEKDTPVFLSGALLDEEEKNKNAGCL